MGKRGPSDKTKIQYFNERDKNHPRNTTYEGIENFDGLVKDRMRTDCCCSLLFILCNLGLIVYFYFTYTSYSFYRLKAGWDFRADLCGEPETTVEHRPYVFFHDPQETGTIGYCVDACPEEDGLETCFYDVDGQTLLDDYCYFTYPTTQFGRWCLPREGTSNRTIVEDYTKSYEFTLRKIANDIYLTYDLIAVAFMITLFFGMIFNTLMLVKKVRKCFFWFVLFLTTCGGGYISWSFYTTRQNYLEKRCEDINDTSDCADDNAFYLLLACFITGGITVGFMLYLFFARHRIKFALRDIHTMFRPIRQVKTVFLYLLLQYLFEALLILGLLFLYVLSMAAGDRSIKTAPEAFPNTEYFTFETPSIYYYLIFYVLLMVLWWFSVTKGFTRCILASLTSCWFYAKEKTILDMPLWRGIKNAFKFHSGTVVMCAVVMPFIWPFKVSMQRIRKRFETKGENVNVKNISKAYRFCLVACMLPLAFYENFIKYASSRNLYQTAIFGDEFCNAGVRLYYLRQRNESRLSRLKNMVGYLVIIGKWVCVMGSTSFVYFFINYQDKTIQGADTSSLDFPSAPPIIVAVTTYFLAHTLTCMMDIIPDVLLICFVADEEMFSGRQRYGDVELKELMDAYGKEAENKNEVGIRARAPVYDIFEEEEFKKNEDDLEIAENVDQSDGGDDKKKPGGGAGAGGDDDDSDSGIEIEKGSDEEDNNNQQKDFKTVNIENIINGGGTNRGDDDEVSVNSDILKGKKTLLINQTAKRDDDDDDESDESESQATQRKATEKLGGLDPSIFGNKKADSSYNDSTILGGNDKIMKTAGNEKSRLLEQLSRVESTNQSRLGADNSSIAGAPGQKKTIVKNTIIDNRKNKGLVKEEDESDDDSEDEKRTPGTMRSALGTSKLNESRQPQKKTIVKNTVIDNRKKKPQQDDDESESESDDEKGEIPTWMKGSNATTNKNNMSKSQKMTRKPFDARNPENVADVFRTSGDSFDVFGQSQNKMTTPKAGGTLNNVKTNQTQELSVLNLTNKDPNAGNTTGVDASAFVNRSKNAGSRKQAEKDSDDSSESDEEEGDDVDANKKDVINDIKNNYMF